MRSLLNQKKFTINYNTMSVNKSIYGSTSGFLSAILLQPLENIKMVLMIPPKDIKLTNNFARNINLSASYLLRQQGIKSFYKGTISNILKSCFSGAVFFSTLRCCENLQKNFQINHQNYSRVIGSFLSSMTARIASTIVANPFSVLETRYEIAGSQRWKGGILESLFKIYRVEGVNGYFKGLLTSCYKEGTFAGFYYALYSEGKNLGLNSIVSGLLSGAIATAITHPFEIVRAERQITAVPTNPLIKNRIFNQIITLFKTKQAFKGLAPRLIKKPCSNTIAFAVFEILQGNEHKY